MCKKEKIYSVAQEIVISDEEHYLEQIFGT